MKILSKITNLFIFTMLFVFASDAWASTAGTGLPWESPLTQISTSLRTSTATSFAVIGVVGCGLSFVFFETNKAMRWCVAIVIGVSVIGGVFKIISMFGMSSVLF